MSKAPLGKKVAVGVAIVAGLAVAGGGAALFLRARAARSTGASSAAAADPVKRVRVQLPFEVAMPILDRKLAAGWEDWGWGRREIAGNDTPRVSFVNFGGVVFQHAELKTYFGALVFRFKAPEAFGDFLEVALKHEQGDESLPKVVLEPSMLAELEDGWKEALVPWRVLNPDNSPVDRVIIRARKPVGDDWVLIDKVLLTKAEQSGVSGAPARGAKLVVDCTKPGSPINPLIYGIARATPDAGESAHRIGGNAMTRLNWELGAWNTGSDWYFENQPGDGPAGPRKWLDENLQQRTKMAMVVPTIGWVAKDTTSVGFPRASFPGQRAYDPHRPEAGDGHSAAGKPLKPGPPTQTSLAATPEVVRRWLQKVREHDRAHGVRSIDMYILDNEPSLWNVTHRDVHPDPLTYDELLDRTVRYASVIREVDPEAVIAGPAEWGWPAYFMSAKDLEVGWLARPDRRAHDDTPMLAWYMEQLAAHEKKTGVRLLDVLDVHFYPQGANLYGKGAKTDPETSALRLRSTRALWDPNYKDESWINDTIRLIPRLKEWVRSNYPGRGISLGEWSFGADDHISGGLAIAEALGRFGQHGLSAAFYWEKVPPGTPGYWAFRAFRNFDGQGGKFLDWSVPTREASDVSLFASRDVQSTRLVLVALNLDPLLAAATQIDVSACGGVKSQRAFVYGPTTGALKPDSVPAAVGGATVSQTVPPYSIAVIELTLAPKAK